VSRNGAKLSEQKINRSRSEKVSRRIVPIMKTVHFYEVNFSRNVISTYIKETFRLLKGSGRKKGELGFAFLIAIRDICDRNPRSRPSPRNRMVCKAGPKATPCVLQDRADHAIRQSYISFSEISPNFLTQRDRFSGQDE
jgi:hypothetical protein